MKKIITLMLLVLIVPAMIFAGRGPVDFSVGANAQYRPFSVVTEELGDNAFENWFNIDSYKFGAETRFKLSVLEFDSVTWFGTAEDLADYSGSDSDALMLDGYTTAGVSFDLLGLVRIGLGGGPSFTYSEAFSGDNTLLIGWTRDTSMNGYSDFDQSIQDYKTTNDVDSDLLAMLMLANFNIRLTADLMVGPLNVGLNMIMPTAFSIKEGNWEELIPSSLDDAMVGVSLGIALF